MMSSEEYKNSIHFLSKKPFAVFYWHKYQQLWYEQYARHESPVITYDATGSVVVAPDSSKHVFLYNVCAITNTGVSKPIGHMLSQINTSNFIGYMLLELFKNIKLPKEVITDNSSALLAASVTSFTRFKILKQYLDCCYSLLNGSSDDIPECYIRLDVSHFVKMIEHSKALKNSDYKMKALYKCAVGVLINSTNFTDFKDTVKNIFTLALNEYNGCNENGEDLPAECALKTLKLAIKNNGLNKIISECATEATDDVEIESNDNDALPNWINEIFLDIYNTIDKIDTSGDGIRENFYQNNKFADYFKKMLIKAPLWSNIMTSIFKCDNIRLASSSTVENSFKDTKHIIFKNENFPIRVDRFVRLHLDSIEGLLKLGIAEQVTLAISQNGKYNYRKYHIITKCSQDLLYI